jgi:hypothetical protein
MRPVGFEPTLCGLKVRCATATPQPRNGPSAMDGWRLQSVAELRGMRIMFSSPFLAGFGAFRSGRPENRTQRDAVISRVWATSPRLPFLLIAEGVSHVFHSSRHWPRFLLRSSRAPRSRTESLLLPKQACYHLHLCPNDFLPMDKLGIEPSSRDCKSKPRPIG